MTADNPLHARWRTFAGLAGVVAICTGALVLVAGWWLGIEALKSPLPGTISMKSITAFAFCLLGGALIAFRRETMSLTVRRAVRAAATLAALLGLLTLGEYLLGVNFGIDQLLAVEPPGTVCTSHPGRMAPNTAACFVLLGLALLLYDRNRERAGQACIFLAGGIAYLAFLGYVYGATPVAGFFAYSRMAPHTALLFLIIAAGLLAARPRAGIMDLLTGDTSGGWVVRPMFLIAVLLPALLGFLRIRGEQLGYFPSVIGTALTIFVMTVALGVFTAIIGRNLHRTDLARRRLEEQNRLLLEIKAQTSDLVAIAESGGSLTYWNRAYAERLLGPKRAVKTIADSHPAWALDKVMKEGLPTAARDGVWGGESAFIDRDGNEFPVSQVIIAHRRPDGSVGHYSTIVRDISATKRVERELRDARTAAEAATRAKSEFLATMSHELRTPLNAINGFSEVLLDGPFGPLNDKQREYVNDILTSGRHLLSLINDILDIAKVEAGKMELEYSECEPGELLKQGLAMVREKAMKNRIRTALTVDGTLGSLRADERKLKQIICNLLSNAVKFTPAGGEIGIRAERIAGNMVRICVRDSGIGIAAADRDKVFAEFEQIDSALARQHKGTGLGMPLTKKLVELHGGTIWLESEGAGRGTSFYFTLPLGPEQAAAPRPAAVESAPSAAPAPGGQGTVLVIEDDPHSVKLFATHLTGAGFAVEHAATGGAGLERARALDPALIILDLMLPDLDGWEIIAELKADARTRNIPVIIASVLGEQERGFVLGAADYLVKPISGADVLAALARLGLRPGVAGVPVLVVDDDPLVRELIAAILPAKSFSVRTADSGEAALALLEKEIPDIVLLDLILPGISGFEVLAAVRANAATCDLPVIILTGKDLTAAEKRELRDRAGKVLAKGEFDKTRFLDEINRLIRTRRDD